MLPRSRNNKHQGLIQQITVSTPCSYIQQYYPRQALKIPIECRLAAVPCIRTFQKTFSNTDSRKQHSKRVVESCEYYFLAPMYYI